MEIQADSKIQKFADYFVVCGLDLKTGLEPDFILGENQLQNTPLDRSYKCHVLTHYPESVPWNPFDKDAICLLSLPHGLRFRTQKHNLDPNFHSFIVTQKDGQRYYGFSLMFYEKAHNEICGAMQTLQAMHLAEVSGGQNRATNATNYNTRSLPRHFKMMSQQFSLMQSYYDVSKDVLYVTKCIVLISQHPYVHASFQFLLNLFRNWKEGDQMSLESYVHYLLNEVKVPPPGYSLSFYINLDYKVTIRTPDLEELPLCDFPIREIFYLIDVDTILYLFMSILLENQVLICSSNYQNLMLVAETLNCLLFPFSWPHVYVPILPASLKHFLDAPVPFIMGVNRNSSPNITTEANFCLVDLENKTVQLPEDLLVFSDHREFASDIVDLLDQYNIPAHNFYRLIKGPEGRYHKARRHDTTAKMSMSSENLLSYSFSSEDDLNKVFDSCQSNFETMNFSTLNGGDVSDYVVDRVFNVAIRELFLNKFVHVFLSYEKFVVPPTEDHEQWLNNKESLQNFDKASFLRERGDDYAFLSQFIETQMFTNFLDAKIQSYWCEKQPNLRIFDRRLHMLRKKHAAVNSRAGCSFENCNTADDYQSVVRDQYSRVDVELPPPEEVFANGVKPSYSEDHFPSLNFSNFKTSTLSRSKKNSRSVGDCSYNGDVMTRSGSEAHPSAFGERLTIIRPTNVNNSPPHVSPAMIAQTNWNFVEKLLKDCKQKTKKMLVAKMGCEAVELGHQTQNTQIEENALIIGLCDLLERIWSHGLQNKQGKSALWYYVNQFRQMERTNDFKTKTESILRTTNSEFSKTLPLSNFSASEETSVFVLEPLPVSLNNDLKFIESLTDIKTPVGLAKAWVRLSLEKKLLSRHLKTMLSNQPLLKSMYKRYAFLRCEDEKEQFLFHLLSLNAVDYYCFTNTYINCVIPYRILIYSSTKIASSLASHCWIVLSGQHGETEKIPIPKGHLEFVFHYKNLGVLTLLRIGQENKSFSLKWLVNWVIARNEITGHVYSFPCGRWLGRGVDDDSSERLLIGKRISETNERGRGFTATRIRSPSVPPMKPYVSDSEIQQNLSECVNGMVKFYYGKPKDNESIATLLCGEQGLVHHLEQVFLFGFRSSRLFGRNLYVWDFIEKVNDEVNATNDGTDEELAYFCKLVHLVRNASASLGREGRFQVFVCVSVRDHTVNSVLKILAESKVAGDMYEEHSFLRKKSLFYFLTHLLDSLYDLDIFLENSVTLGISVESPL